jgi:hypothetical protein
VKARGAAKEPTSNCELTEDQMQDIRDAFELFDLDGKGLGTRACACVHVCMCMYVSVCVLWGGLSTVRGRGKVEKVGTPLT